MAKMTKMGDDTLKAKDNGKKKITIKASGKSTDSTNVYSYSKNIEKPKRGISSSLNYNHIDSLKAKVPFYHNESSVQKTESPKRKAIVSNTSLGRMVGENRYQDSDSAYSQTTRKPTERREGREVTKIKKMESSSPSYFGLSAPVVNVKTVKKLPKLAPKKKGS
jgi:hypothetical protein